MKSEINHPSHYQSGIECIDYLEDLGLAKDFALASAIKYVWRAGEKDFDAVRDLQKARWYLNWLNVGAYTYEFEFSYLPDLSRSTLPQYKQEAIGLMCSDIERAIALLDQMIEKLEGASK